MIAPIRAFNAVCRAKIRTVEELRERYQTEPERLRLLVGKHHCEEISRALAETFPEKFSESCTETYKKSRFSDYLQKGYATESTPESEVTPMTEPRTTPDSSRMPSPLVIWATLKKFSVTARCRSETPKPGALCESARFP